MTAIYIYLILKFILFFLFPKLKNKAIFKVTTVSSIGVSLSTQKLQLLRSLENIKIGHVAIKIPCKFSLTHSTFQKAHTKSNYFRGITILNLLVINKYLLKNRICLMRSAFLIWFFFTTIHFDNIIVLFYLITRFKLYEYEKKIF